MAFRQDAVMYLTPDIISVSSASGSVALLNDSKTAVPCQDGTR